MLEEFKSLREEKLKNSDLQGKDQDSSCQNVAIHYDQQYQKKQDQKKDMDKILSNKYKEINYLKNHS